MQASPNHITKLKPNEVFVFGSNTLGIHGAGAALFAKQNFGAVQGVGIGLTGQCYAFPTKDGNLQTLHHRALLAQAQTFAEVVRYYKDKHFLVTMVGCGLAGRNPRYMAPLFRDVANLPNVFLPKSFIEELQK